MDAAVRVAAVLRLVLHRDVLLALGSGVLVALALLWRAPADGHADTESLSTAATFFLLIATVLVGHVWLAVQDSRAPDLHSYQHIIAAMNATIAALRPRRWRRSPRIHRSRRA